MSDHKHFLHTIRVRILKGADAGVKKIAWPSLDDGKGGTSPIPLPAEPQVELLPQADGTSKIIVTCTCGKRIEIVCEA